MSRHFRLTSSTETEYDTRDLPSPYQPRQSSGADDCYEEEERMPFYPTSPSGNSHTNQDINEASYPLRSPEAFQPYNNIRRPRSASIPFVLDSGHDFRPSSSASHRVDRILVEQDSLTSPPYSYQADESRMRCTYVPRPLDSPDSPSGRQHRPRARTLEGLFASRHNRSHSYRGSSARSDNYDDIDADVFRPRVSTMPSCNNPSPHGEEGQFYLARNFSHNEKGEIINRGDCYREGSRSNTSVCSSSSNKSSPAAVLANEGGPPLKVMMLGGVGVGKSALVSQFMSSEYVNAYEFSCDEEEIRPVSVVLDDDEFYLCFIDHPICSDLSHSENADEQESEADAYLVVFSITDGSSFQKAEEILRKLRQQGAIQKRAVILVANKCDLVRSREVSEHHAKDVACRYECKYSEVSAALKHNVDELFVGLITQIKLKAEQQRGSKKADTPDKGRRHSKTQFLGTKTRCFFEKLFGRGEHIKSRSCENLQEL